MRETTDRKSRRLWKPLLVSLIGIAIVAPAPIMAGAPTLLPAWLLQPLAGAPLLSWLMLLLMLGLVILVTATLKFMDDSGD